MPIPDHAHVAGFRALYLRHEPQRHAQMRGPQADRKYTEYRQPITDTQIAAHLDGRITLAAPMIGSDGLAQAAALDVDSGGTAVLKQALEAAHILGWTAYAITSTNDEHDGGHIWIHLDSPTTPNRARLLAQKIAATAEIEAETYPTRKQLRLPLGVHRWTGKRGTLLLQDGTAVDLDSGDDATDQALEVIASLPTNSAERLPELAPPAQPARSSHTPPTTRQNVPGSAKDAITAYNQATDLISLLESYGGRIAERISGGGVLMHCPCGRHSHGDRRPSLAIRPARSSRYGRYVAHGYSTNCQFYTEHGQVMAPFDVRCKLDSVSPVEALKQINPCRPTKPARSRRDPEPEHIVEPTWKELTAEQRAHTAKQRQQRIEDTHALHAEIRARIEADPELSLRARAVLEAMLDWSTGQTFCRLSVKRIAVNLLQVSTRTVQRGMDELEQRGYIQSEAYCTASGQCYKGGYTTTKRNFLRVTISPTPCHPYLTLESDLNPQDIKACEHPRDSPAFVPGVVVSCDGGASYDPAEDWTLQAEAAPQPKPWRAMVSPKEFYTRYRALRERTSCAPAEELPRRAQAAEGVVQAAQDAAQAMLALEQSAAPSMPTAAQAQLSHLQTQIWRRPPSDPKKCRTYYALQRKAAQVERSNPRQAHALKMQARTLEEVSELLIAATSCTDEVIDDHRQADADRRQDALVPVTGRTSSEPPAAPLLLLGIQRRPRLVNITPRRLSSTSIHAEAAPRLTGGGSHAQTIVKSGEFDEIWISAKRRQIAALERDGHQERAAALRRMLGWDALAERGNVAVGHVHAVVPKLAREFEAGVPFSKSGLDAAQEEALGKGSAQAVHALGVNVEIGADFPHSVLQAATEGRAIGPKPVATCRNGSEGNVEFSASRGIEAGADDALLTPFGVGAAHGDHDVFPVEIGFAQAGNLGMAQAGGPEQIEHAHQLIASAAQGQGSADLNQLLRTVAATSGAASEAGVQVLRDQLIGSVGIPLPTVHAFSELAQGSESRLEVGIGCAPFTENAQATLDELGGHVAEHAGLLITQGIEENHAAIAVGIEGTVAEDPLVGGAVQLGLMAGSSFLKQAAQEAIDLVLERWATAHGGAP